MKENYTLITGASKGIGLELTHYLAKNKNNLILVARSKGLLDKIKIDLQKKFDIKVIVLVADLTKEGIAKEIYDYTTKENINVNVLINNAGFGDYGNFVDTSTEKNRNMVQLNIVTLTELCQYYLKDMIKNKDGKIMNVASIASFLPGPLMATYYATKAYVLSFTEALAKELVGTGVSITALCPGTTKTQFFDVANANKQNSNLLNNMKPADPKKVALYGYKKMMKGKVIALYGTSNKILVFLIRFVPRTLVRSIAYKIQSKRSK